MPMQFKLLIGRVVIHHWQEHWSCPSNLLSRKQTPYVYLWDQNGMPRYEPLLQSTCQRLSPRAKNPDEDVSVGAILAWLCIRPSLAGCTEHFWKISLSLLSTCQGLKTWLQLPPCQSGWRILDSHITPYNSCHVFPNLRQRHGLAHSHCIPSCSQGSGQ